MNTVEHQNFSYGIPRAYFQSILRVRPVHCSCISYSKLVDRICGKLDCELFATDEWISFCDQMKQSLETQTNASDARLGQASGWSLFSSKKFIREWWESLKMTAPKNNRGTLYQPNIGIDIGKK